MTLWLSLVFCDVSSFSRDSSIRHVFHNYSDLFDKRVNAVIHTMQPLEREWIPHIIRHNTHIVIRGVGNLKLCGKIQEMMPQLWDISEKSILNQTL